MNYTTPVFAKAGRSRAPRRLAFAFAAALVALPFSGCDRESLLQVTDPELVTPESLAGPTGLRTIFAGAIGDFMLGYAGGPGAGSFADNATSMSALMSDEMFISGTFPTRIEFDQRSIDVKNGTLRDAFHRLHRGRAAAERAAARLDAGATGGADARVGELFALAGFAYVAFAEVYCSGVPVSQVTEAGELEFGSQQTTQAVLQTAIQRFDQAIAKAAGNATVVNLARVGKARAQLDLGQFPAAAATAAPVPTSFVYNLFASINATVPTGNGTFSLENGIWAANTSQRRLSVSDSEAGEGLPFRSANDPRVPFARNPQGGFDSTSPQFNLLTFAQNKQTLGRETPFPLASGIEARLIEAEAALKAGGAAAAFTLLNALRTGMTPLTDPGTEAGRVDTLFRERAFWLYATGHRLGDLRRLIRQYGRTEDATFPSGAFFKSGGYGDDVNYPIPFEEENNPQVPSGQTCLDRKA